MLPATRNFRYRNRQGAWLDFHYEGLTLAADGALELVALPLADPPVLIDAAPQPAALAFDSSGDLYFTRAGHVALRRCGMPAEDLPIEAPRVLAFSARRSALLALYADRLVVYDLPGIVESEVWYDDFQEARTLAVDEGGQVYIGDEQGVRRYFLSGQADAAFSIPAVVTALAVAGDRIYALEEGFLDLFDLDGRELSSSSVETSGFGLAVAGATVYVGEDDGVAVLHAGADGLFHKVGDAAGYTGPVSALAARNGRLYVHPGTGEPVGLTLSAAYGTAARLYSGALDASGHTVEWSRVRAWMDLPDTCTVQFFFHTGDNAAATPHFPDEWQAVAAGASDFFVGSKAKYIRVGAVIGGDGANTVRLRQIRTDFDQQGFATYLPEVFREAGNDDHFLDRFLGAFESLFDDAGDRIGGLTSMLDPDAAAPEDLDWLAGFLALELPQTLGLQARRSAIRQAFELYAQRGTAAGLAATILSETGVHAIVQEPFASGAWWQMPAHSPECAHPDQWVSLPNGGLGAGTVLAGASPQGAVLGSGAVLDQSHLIGNDEYGMPLFGDLAYRFNVLLYEGEVACPEKRAAVEAIIEREKPAHTAAHICVIRPAFRIGWQGILGVETVVGGTRAAARLGDGPMVLDGAEAGRLGESATVGISSRL